MVIIQPIGGLCNRIRAINSAYLLARERRDKLTVLWLVNKDLGCPCEELFLENRELRVINIRSALDPRRIWYRTTSRFVDNGTIHAHRGDGLLDEEFRHALPSRIYIATEEHFYPSHDYHL
ncbi:MAG: hypothetical protein J6P60_06265, partial [Lachnospiraceae bacterium]|nr:hypothetical protein [Lachnospiraceae bacterium]